MNASEIIVFGYNPIGVSVIERLLWRKQKFLIADHHSENVEKALSEGLPARLIDLTDDEALLDYGLGKSVKSLFCMLEQDSENVFLTISARAIDPRLDIISVCLNDDANSKLLAAGANKIINPFQITARKIFENIRKPVVVELLDEVVFGQHDLHLGEINIEADSLLDQSHFNELDIKDEFNLIIIGVEDKERSTIIQFASSGTNFKLDAGDKLIVLGPSNEIYSFNNKYAKK